MCSGRSAAKSKGIPILRSLYQFLAAANAMETRFNIRIERSGVRFGFDVKKFVAWISLIFVRLTKRTGGGVFQSRDPPPFLGWDIQIT